MYKRKCFRIAIITLLLLILISSNIYNYIVFASDSNNLKVHKNTPDNENWGVSAMGLDKYIEKLEKEGNDTEIKVAIIDTGININHEVFEGRLDLNPIYARNYIDDSTDITDVDGRGTEIASIIAQSTPSNVKIIPAKVLNVDTKEEMFAQLDNIYNALTALSREADVLCFTLGIEHQEYFPSQKQLEDFDKMLDREIYGEPNDTILINNVGDLSTNGSRLPVQFPSFVNRIVAVTGVDTSFTVQDTACIGPEVDFACPGVGVKVATLSNNGYKTVSGTKYAAAFLCSAWATVKSELKGAGLSPTTDDIMDVLKANCVDIGDEGKDNYYGYGFLNFNSNMFATVQVDVENSSSGKATVIFDNDNSSNSDFSAEVKEGNVSVTCDNPCLILTTSDDGESYTVLEGTASASLDNTYDFSFDLEEGINIVVTIKGDTDFNGIVNGNDVVDVKNLIKSGEAENLSALQSIIYNLDGETILNGNDVVALKNVIKGSESFTW